MDPLTTFALGTGIGTFNTGVNAITSGIFAGRQYKYNKKLQDDAFNKNVEMWNMQNAYNAPSAQMQRLGDAGLNPNLVYGNGSVQNTSATAPTYQAGEVPKYQQFPADFGKYMLTALQADNLKSQTGLNRETSALRMAETYQKTLESLGEQLDNARKQKDLDLYDTLKQLEIGILKKQEQSFDYEFGLKSAQTATEHAKAENFNASSENFRANTRLTLWEVDNAQTKLNALLAETDSRIQVNKATTRSLVVGLNEIYARVQNLKASTVKFEAESLGINANTKTTDELRYFLIHNEAEKLFNSRLKNRNLLNFGQEQATGQIAGTVTGMLSFLYGLGDFDMGDSYYYKEHKHHYNDSNKSH